MKNLMPLFVLCLVLSFFSGVQSQNLVLDTFLIGKASSTKFGCLLSALNRVNEEDKVTTDRADWSNIIHEGVQQGIDINTLLLQYHYLMTSDRDQIKECELSLDRAMERCKAVYSDCSEVPYNDATFTTDAATASELLPFVTRKCPENYIRYGCCSCMRKCLVYPELFELDEADMHGYCVKKAATVSRLSDKQETEDWEVAGDKWVERCVAGWARVGTRLCVPKCPLGWNDHGDRCLKTGKINLIPFSWQPGDEE